ncbi:MAG TPA: hypothetical protein VHN11_21495 [Xanthobacteraceae bacterium]|jgi:hypothetical protein|nr:hypothetical protein [Xanthobacteraceae bacterium]
MKLLRLFVAVLLVAAPTVSYAGVTQTQIPQGRGAVVYIQLEDGTFVPVSDDNPMPVTGGSGGGGGDVNIDEVGGVAIVGDEVPVHDQDMLDAVNGPVPAGTNTIGGTLAESATGSAVPAKASYAGANSGGNLTGIIQADASAKIDISTATTTQLVALSSGKKIYITNYKVIAGGTGNFKFVYGTGTNCGTGTTDLEGANNLTAQAGSVAGSGLGPVLVVPASNALCATTSAAVQMSGHVAYTQF